jgi:3-hydroxy acid dehydrogenase/malonic semialdehyde reductase
MSRTVMITGATAGFGEACARLFASEGWQLILTGRRAGRLEKLRAELGTKVHIIVQDVRNRQAVENDLANLPADFLDVDVLVNNAGLALGLGPAQEADLDQWEQMVDTNIKGLMYCTRFILPGMVARNRGHIINLGSVAGNWPYPGGNVYGATKSFVKQFSHNLRTDVLGTAVRVTNIEPGLAETEFSIVRFKGDRDKAREFYKGTRPLSGEDIARIVVWAVDQPPHVNINRVEVMPVCQSCGPFKIHREDE